MKNPEKESDKERFIRVAKELGCDENAPLEDFVESLKKLLPARPKPKKR